LQIIVDVLVAILLASLFSQVAHAQRKFRCLGVVNLLCPDISKRRRPVTKGRPLVTARHRHPDMVKAGHTTISTGSIANDLRTGSTRSASA
jgi:hypothetical protein